jgi:hypothetical protein
MTYPDMSRCPQTEAEFSAYFYTLIGRRLGTDAWDWSTVLSAAYPWNGQSLRIPEGVGPGVRQPPDAPFFGLTQQWSNGPKARLFLPTNQPDDLGYYTRCMQYLDSAHGRRAAAAETEVVAQALRAEEFPATAKGAKSSGLVWAWYWIAGYDYAPVQGAGGGGVTPPVPPSAGGGLTEDQVNEMIEDALVPVYKALEQALKMGDKVALRLDSGLFAGAVSGGPGADGQPVEWVAKSAAHAWEMVKLEPEGSD